MDANELKEVSDSLYKGTEIPNYEEICNNEKKMEILRHGPLFPAQLRAIFCGPSGSGKTNFFCELMFAPIQRGGLLYNRLVVCAPASADQQKYELMTKVFNEASGVEFHKLSSIEELQQFCQKRRLPSKPLISGLCGSIVCLDDLFLKEEGTHRLLCDLFCVSRHFSIDVILLFQSYATIPKFFRDQSNFLALFKLDSQNLRLIHRDCLFSAMTFGQFCEFAKLAWNTKFQPLIIDKTRDVSSGGLRAGILKFLTHAT